MQHKKPSLNFILSMTAAFIALVILFVSAVTLVRREDDSASEYRHSDPTPQTVVNKSQKKNAKLATYSSLGEIRAVTKRADENSSGTTLVVIPWFSYPDGDTALYEELVQKTRQFQSIFLQYFSSYTQAELLQKGETAIKDELKAQVNAELVLGDITDVYFSDYMFFE